MATLKKLPYQATFDVFDLKLDDKEQSAFRKDPTTFMRKVLLDEKATVNRLVIDDTILGDGGAPPPRPPEPRVFHCVSPAEHQSTYITILLM